MKRIEAIIKPFKLDDVMEGLNNLGIQGITVMDSKGFGRQKGQGEVYRGAEYVVELLPKVIVVIFVSDDMLDAAIEAIQLSARTGKFGDGIITVYDIQHIVRVRTGERDKEVLE